MPQQGSEVTSAGNLILSLGVYVSRMGVDEAKKRFYTLLENLEQRVDNMLQMRASARKTPSAGVRHHIVQDASNA
jgi:hypothetical protein